MNLEARLRKQQLESEIDSRWLHQEESNLKKRLSLITAAGGQEMDNLNNGGGGISDNNFYQQQNVRKFSPQNSVTGQQNLNEQCPSTPNSTTDSRPHTPGSNPGTLKTTKSMSMERCSTPTGGGGSSSDEKLMKKTLQLDRDNDQVYEATKNVVKSIMVLTQGVENPVGYLDLVKNIGVELRTLLSSVDQLTTSFPPQAHKYINLYRMKIIKFF